jgi:hypothetical protein
MNTYKHKNFTKRDYKCTNVVACVSKSAPNDNYIPFDESILTGLSSLWMENGVKYYGYL